MNKNSKLVLISVVIGVCLNLVLPFVLKPLATKEQVSPSNGAANLSFVDQLMHMFVHHAQVPLTSSIIVAIIVGLSVYLAKFVKL